MGVSASTCQREYMALPAGGWALAPDDADAVAVAAAYVGGQAAWCMRMEIRPGR